MGRQSIAPRDRAKLLATAEIWPLVRLGDIAEFRNGLNFTNASTGESVKVIGVGDFQRKEVLDDFALTKHVITNSAVREDDLLLDGDLLFVRSNGNKALVGRCVEVRPAGERISFSGFTIRARVRSERADSAFVSMFARSDLFQRHLLREGSGSSISNLSQAMLEDFEFPLPSLPEQRRIAAVLRTWDDAIDACDRLVAANERQLTALTNKLVFGGGESGSARVRKRGEWFSVPQRWGILPVAELASEVSVRNADAVVSEVLSCSKHRGFVRSLEYFGKQIFSADLSTYKVIQRGDFGFPSNHVEEGSIGLQNIADVGVVSPIYVVFRFDASRVHERYAFRVLKTQLFRHLYAISTSASVDRRGSLRWSDFSKLPFPVPPLGDQEAIVRVLEDQDRLVQLVRDRRDALKNQKRGLMQKLLTGEWRVPDKEPSVA